MIAIDFETHLISEDMPVPKPVCLSYYINGEDKGLLVGFKDMHWFLDNILSMKDTIIIAHNASFEALVIYHWFPDLKEKLKAKYRNKTIRCTKVYEQTIDKLRRKCINQYSLSKLVDWYFKEDISETKTDPDAWRLRYSELEDIPKNQWPQDAIDYAIQDSVYAYDIYQKQKQTDVEVDVTTKADFYLNLMGLNGIYIDKDRVSQLEKELVEILEPVYNRLIDKDLVKYDKGKYKKSMKQFKEHIQSLDIKLEHTTKGGISTSAESLGHYYAESKDEVIKDFLTINKYEKVLSAFVTRLKKVKDVVRTQYNPIVGTGRTSSRGSDNFPSVNIQQMPREVPDVTYDIRNCFIPRPGYCIVSIDYTGLELSSTANQLYTETGQSYMRDVINSGSTPVDLHSKFACRIMSLKEGRVVTYEEFLANKKEKPYSYYRQLAKPINLGFPGGIGYDTMRSLLAKEGIHPKLLLLEKSKSEHSLIRKRFILRSEGYPVRIRRKSYSEYELIYDELVLLKQELFGLYPDLKDFLTEYHKNLLNGSNKSKKNEFGEWEVEPLYNYSVPGFHKCNVEYTQVCNGMLMQSPSSVGAKRVVNNICEYYEDKEDVNPIAFIHDELVFEVKTCYNMKQNIQDLSEMMIDGMQEVMPHIRIIVEAEAFEYWKKAGGFYSTTYWKDPKDKQLKGGADD